MSEEPLSTALSEWADGAEEGLVIFCLGHTIHLGRRPVFMILKLVRMRSSTFVLLSS